MRIGELAALAGVSTRTVRHYHHVGLLPEPERGDNGYRVYRLGDLVRLLRARRLVELGLSLDEVVDALTDDDGKGLTEILIELDGDLAARQRRLQAQREQIGELLAAEGGLRSPDLDAVIDELSRVAGPDHPGLERERLIAEVVETVAGADAPSAWAAYRRVLADRELTANMLAAMRRFELLADLPADDPAVDALADEASGFADVVSAALPAEARAQAGDPNAAERLLNAISAGMAPAQKRCLRLMFTAWRRATS